MASAPLTATIPPPRAEAPVPDDRSARLRSLVIARDGAPVAREMPAPARRRDRRGWLLGAGLLAQTGVIVWLMFGNSPPAAAPAPAAIAVRSTAAGAPAPAAALEAQGFVQATRRATISTRVAGVVTAVEVDAGDRVAKGQVLGHLDDSLARREVEVAETQLLGIIARVKNAQKQLLHAQHELEREQAVFEKRFSTAARLEVKQSAVETAETLLEVARDEMAVQRLQIQQQMTMLQNYTLRAPFAGIVVEKNAQVGELLAPAGASGGFTRTGLLTIVDMASLEIVVDVSEQMLRRVRIGQPVNIRLYAFSDLTLKGEVARIMPSADRAKGTLQVRIAIKDPDPRVLPDMGARVAFL
ncbi:efflux RND transporter periplasmic adaptor subunit [Sandaracinobacteroides saxicola]|uniref:Efflux RND transporter periplasmic adaptor subunit n=1 Tax=Sandaracinobacteroides saxicola TaxID=2759707 RepID=A0A7G5IIT3_9SPHN|nr:efflux RND transporter periplasmic adaptor subunit [Sandaracinobacteroides saxicola]QMW23275.1 efflux RND transporter periplasmic adaptor subunit [Sandaracinobacteroides saxicola]